MEGEKFQTLSHRSDMTGADRAWAARYQPGNIVQYTTGSKQLGIARSSFAIVLATNSKENTVTVEQGDGKTVTYNPARLRGVNVFEPVEREFSKGDRLQFTAPDKALGVVRRELGTITELRKDRITVRMDGKDGHTVSFDPKEFRSIDHGYTVTSYGAQGLTAERTLINIDVDGPRGLVNQRLAYVAVSRAAEEAQIYTNDAQGLAAAVSHDHSKTSAVEFRAPAQFRDADQHRHVQPTQNPPEAKQTPSIQQKPGPGLGLELGI